MVVCQFSLYPLREQKLGPVLNEAVTELRAAGLRPDVGTMSTYVEGDGAAVFDGLRRAFEAAAGRGDVVLVATVSNACPIEPRPGD
jgi:uncharacterized protein YqgV (UPF0045/DUF77 family)